MNNSFKTTNEAYIPALRFHWLTRFYDIFIGLTTREPLVKNTLIHQAKLANDYKVLDVGCGTGTLACWIKQHYPKAEVFGLDGDKNILLIAANKAHQDKIQIQFDLGLSYDLPYPDNYFDRVVSSLFFHHLTLAQKERTLSELLRVLKPGSELHIADWGEPNNLLMKILFYQVQFLDGFETTRENVNGMLPMLIRNTGYVEVQQHNEYNTMFGTLVLLSAKKSS